MKEEAIFLRKTVDSGNGEGEVLRMTGTAYLTNSLDK